MSAEMVRKISDKVEDVLIAERPQFYVGNILELRQFNEAETGVIRNRFKAPLQLKSVLNLQKGTILRVFCSPDDYHWDILTAEASGKIKHLFSIDGSNSVYAAPKYPEIPDFPKQFLSKIAEEKRSTGIQLQLEDKYQVSGEYLGKSLGIIIEHLRDHFGYLEDDYKLFNKFKNVHFKDDSVISNILREDWPAVRKNFKLGSGVKFSKLEISLLTQIASALRSQSAQIVANHCIKFWEVAREKQIGFDFQMAKDSKTSKLPGWKEKFDFEIITKTHNRLKIVKENK